MSLRVHRASHDLGLIDLPSIPWPDIDLPSLPWPDIPWPEISLPDVPDWVGLPVKVAVAMLVAYVVARGEIRRRRNREGEQASSDSA